MLGDVWDFLVPVALTLGALILVLMGAAIVMGLVGFIHWEWVRWV